MSFRPGAQWLPGGAPHGLMAFSWDVIELLIAESGLARLSKHRFVQQPDALRANDYGLMNEKLFLFLDKLVSDYCRFAGMMETGARALGR